MTDFMRWLYANYIKPQLDSQDTSGYETPLSLMDTCLDEHLKIQYDRTLEFYASQAFLLGLRTGTGLKDASRPQPLCTWITPPGTQRRNDAPDNR